MATWLHERSSMKLQAWVLLLSLGFSACVAGDDSDVTDVEISATDPNGKADAIDGKRLRIRTTARIPWFANADMTKWNVVQIDAAASERVIASGIAFGFDVSDKLLSLGVEKRIAGLHRLGFLVRDALASQQPFTCARGGLTLNFFDQLTIDAANRVVYANGEHTFSFAECGIEPGGPTWSFEVFVLPLAATGRLEGAYEYRMSAEIH